MPTNHPTNLLSNHRLSKTQHKARQQLSSRSGIIHPSDEISTDYVRHDQKKIEHIQYDIEYVYSTFWCLNDWQTYVE